MCKSIRNRMNQYFLQNVRSNRVDTAYKQIFAYFNHKTQVLRIKTMLNAH